MPLCTAVLAAALFTGPAAVPPDPDPTGTRTTTDKNTAGLPWDTRQPATRPLAPLPGMAPQAGQFPFPFPQAPPWMAPGGVANRGADAGLVPGSPAGAAAPKAPVPGAVVPGAAVPGATGEYARPAANAAARPVTRAAAPGVAADGAAGTAGEVKVVPIIDPKTRDVLIQPVFGPGKPGEPPRPFTFRPVQGVQTAKAYPQPRAQQKTGQQRTPQQKTGQQKTGQQKTVQRSRQHQWPGGW